MRCENPLARKRGPRSFRGDDNRWSSVTVNRRSCFVSGPNARRPQLSPSWSPWSIGRGRRAAAPASGADGERRHGIHRHAVQTGELSPRDIAAHSLPMSCRSLCSGNVLPIPSAPHRPTPRRLVQASVAASPNRNPRHRQIDGTTRCNVSKSRFVTAIRAATPTPRLAVAPAPGPAAPAAPPPWPTAAAACTEGAAPARAHRRVSPASTAARTKHGAYNAGSRAFHAGCRTLVVRSNLLIKLSRDPAFSGDPADLRPFLQPVFLPPQPRKRRKPMARPHAT